MRLFWIVLDSHAVSLGALVGLYTISDGHLSVTLVLAFLIALPLAGAVSGRSGISVSLGAAIAVAIVAYLVSTPAVAALERWMYPQDLTVLVWAILIAGLAIIPFGVLGLKVVNAAVLPLATKTRFPDKVR
jgi:hypothetical protein